MRHSGCARLTPVSYTHLDVYKRQAQDAFEDALLMECREDQIREVFRNIIESLENPYNCLLYTSRCV